MAQKQQTRDIDVLHNHGKKKNKGKKRDQRGYSTVMHTCRCNVGKALKILQSRSLKRTVIFKALKVLICQTCQTCHRELVLSSGHPALSSYLPKSRKSFPLITVKPSCINWSPLLSGRGHLFRGPNEQCTILGH